MIGSLRGLVAQFQVTVTSSAGATAMPDHLDRLAHGPRESWPATTHSWADSVDLAHLGEARRLVGTIGPDELVHMVLEVVAYADDEAEDRGKIGTVTVTDSQVSIVDDGRGTDTRREPDGSVVRKPIMSTKDLRFFGQPNSPLLPDGRPRRGISTVAAVCTELIHENRRKEGAWAQTYQLGVPLSELVEASSSEGTGTAIHLNRLAPGVVAGLDLHTLEELLREFRHVKARVQ
jgi:DNA gyrase/topoisomerase IV subunit B